MRRVPIIPTIIVVSAILTMIGLGVWQLHRAEWKAGLLARYQTALSMSAEVPFPHGAQEIERSLYRRATISCGKVLERGAISGRSLQGEQGWAQTVRCATAGGPVDVSLGWTNAPGESAWQGGVVSGAIAPAGKGARLIAMPALAGLGDLAAPDPNELPNNHMAYAWQWFFFAATALVIYLLALRKRWGERSQPPPR